MWTSSVDLKWVPGTHIRAAEGGRILLLSADASGRRSKAPPPGYIFHFAPPPSLSRTPLTLPPPSPALPLPSPHPIPHGPPPPPTLSRAPLTSLPQTLVLASAPSLTSLSISSMAAPSFAYTNVVVTSLAPPNVSLATGQYQCQGPLGAAVSPQVTPRPCCPCPPPPPSPVTLARVLTPPQQHLG